MGAQNLESTNFLFRLGTELFGSGTGQALAVSIAGVGGLLYFLNVVLQLAGRASNSPNPGSPPPPPNPIGRKFLGILSASFGLFVSGVAVVCASMNKGYEAQIEQENTGIAILETQIAELKSNQNKITNDLEKAAVQVNNILNTPAGKAPVIFDNESFPDKNGSQVVVVQSPPVFIPQPPVVVQPQQIDLAPFNNAINSVNTQVSDARKQMTVQSGNVIETLNSNVNADVILAKAVKGLMEKDAERDKQLNEFVNQFAPQPIVLTLAPNQGISFKDVFIQCQFDGTIQVFMNGRPLQDSSSGKFIIDRGDRTMIISGKYQKESNLTTVRITESRQPN